MTHQKNVKIQLGAALLLCFLALALCLPLVFIAAHAQHDCQGAHCPVCLHIGQAVAALRSFAAAGIFMLSSALFGCLPVLTLADGAVRWPARRSLVALRTRMDD